MGTFAIYIGEVSIPEEKKYEYNKNMMRLLQLGGMVDFYKVSMYHKEINLISPVSLDKNGECDFHYNYFEDDPWEDAGFNSNSNRLWSNKIGSNEFNFVICAAYVLTELYSEGYGCASENGEILNYPGYVQWINFILDKEFSLEKRFDLWKMYENYGLQEIEDGYGTSGINCSLIRNFVPAGHEEYMGGIELADILYIDKGTELDMENARESSYAREVFDLKNELRTYFLRHKLNGKEEVFQLITMSRDIRSSKFRDTDLFELSEISLRVAARVFVYLSAEIMGFSFWDEWKNIYDKVYQDEEIPDYVGNGVIEKRKEGRRASLGKMKTSEFLKNDSFFTFYGTPEEIKHKDNYYISDDDLMYWWDEDGKVELSEKIVELIHKWKEDYDEILKNLSAEDTSEYDMLKNLITVLDFANDFYKRIFAFQDMFYEFIEHGKDERYIAFVKLFEKIVEDNKEMGSIIEYAKGRWEMTSKNVTFNEGRVTIKRFLSLAANKKLRDIYFGF